MPTDQAQGTETLSQQGDGDSARKSVTLEDVNRAITSRFSAFEKKIDKVVSALDVDKLSAMLEERFAPKADTVIKPGEEKKQPSIEESPQFKGMQKRLADMEAARDAERAKARDVSMRQRLGDELAKHGVDPSRARHAMALLVDSERRVKWSEEGDSLLFRDNDTTEVDLSTGLKSWMKTDDGKLYLPPRGTQGSGGRAGTNANGGTGNPPMQRGEVARALLASVGELPDDK